MMFNDLIFLSFIPVVLGSMRYVVDRRSCNTDELYDKVKYCMENSKTRAQLVAGILSPIITDPDNNQLSDRIKDKANLLFGKSDITTISNLFAKYDEIQKFVWVDIDNWSDAWINDRDLQDLEIFCNADYIVDDSGNPEKNINWLDTVQFLPIPDGSALLDLKDPKSNTLAVTSPSVPRGNGQRWPTASPEVIAFHPKYLTTVLKDNTLFNDDRINKAVSTALLDRIKSKFNRVIRSLTNIDILDTMESTMLHELTHLNVPGHADDSDDDNSYGWVNCVRLKDITNAESLMFFAVTVDLIQNHHVDVDEKGKLSRFT